LQLELKVEAARETLYRLGGLPRDLPVEVVAGLPWAYRQRAQLHTEGDGDSLRVGYRARRSRSVVSVDVCPILVPELERQLATLKNRLPSPPPRRLDLIVGDEGVLTTAPVTSALPHGELAISVGDWTYEVDARCFFQGHRQLLSELVELAVGPWEGDHAYDLYAGVGLLSLPLARRYRQVVAVEGDRIAGRYARRNARRSSPGQVEVVISAVESWISHLPQGVARVVVDPPRVGLSRRVREVLCARRPARLTYISCHPATLARDLNQLVDGYEIERIALLDLFPQTGHVELIVQLVA
jgi:23S rRNA (uracil1939-C5)-methyltransferase